MSADFNHDPYPSHETLAAFIDGRLGDAERQRVLQHISECAECRDVVAMSAEMAPEVLRESNVVPMRRRWVLPAAAMAIAALILIALLTPIRSWLMPRESGIASLAAVAPPYRPFDGRLAGFPYRPTPPRMRGGPESADDSDKLATIEVADKIRIAAEKRPDAQNLHALADAMLLTGDAESAAQQIDRALMADTGAADPHHALGQTKDVALLNDVATIYAARAQRTESARDRLMAFDAANAALKLQPRSAEAAWNRAVVMESMRATKQAIAAWNDYLGIDAKSPWADEARRHLADLKSSG